MRLLALRLQVGQSGLGVGQVGQLRVSKFSALFLHGSHFGAQVGDGLLVGGGQRDVEFGGRDLFDQICLGCQQFIQRGARSFQLGRIDHLVDGFGIVGILGQQCFQLGLRVHDGGFVAVADVGSFGQGGNQILDRADLGQHIGQLLLGSHICIIVANIRLGHALHFQRFQGVPDGVHIRSVGDGDRGRQGFDPGLDIGDIFLDRRDDSLHSFQLGGLLGGEGIFALQGSHLRGSIRNSGFIGVEHIRRFGQRRNGCVGRFALLGQGGKGGFGIGQRLELIGREGRVTRDHLIDLGAQAGNHSDVFLKHRDVVFRCGDLFDQRFLFGQ